MKETYYFSHDSNARNDEKILMLRAEHGWQGYGIYWALLEMMFEAKETCLSHAKVKGIAISYNVDITLLESVINTCETERLFVSDGVIFWSESLRERKQKFLELRQQKSEAGKRGMVKRWGPDNTVITENNKVITENNKVKESKEKESKRKEKKVKEIKEVYRTIQHLILTVDDYNKLRENFNEQDIEGILDEMENWAKLKTKRSAYLTANNWLKDRQRKREQEQQKPSYRPNVQKALDLVKKTQKEQEGSDIW